MNVQQDIDIIDIGNMFHSLHIKILYPLHCATFIANDNLLNLKVQMIL